MDPIEGVELAELTKEMAAEVVAENRRRAGGQIKKLYQRIMGLTSDIKNKETELRKLREKLRTAQAKIDKLRAGDWSVLDEPKAEEGK